MNHKDKLNSFFIFIAIACTSMVHADGLAIDKVYDPYVQPLERELEWRSVHFDGEQQQRLGIGKSLSDRLFVEVYLTTNSNEESIDVYELEAKWQLTEQGEYAADWGVLVELEKDRHDDNWELATGLLMAKEWGHWTGTANIKAIYEWGSTIKPDLESSLALQARYRYSRYFEPALEFYSGQNTRGFGPVVMGDVKFSAGKKVHWEVGSILGLDSTTPDNTWRFLMEFEF